MNMSEHEHFSVRQKEAFFQNVKMWEALFDGMITYLPTRKREFNFP